MRRPIAAALLAACLLPAAACSPAGAPPPDTVNLTGNAAGDELLDTSPDSLAAPDDAGSGKVPDPLAEPANAAH